MTAIFGYFNNDSVFMAADRRRSGGGIKQITNSPKFNRLINNIYIASAGAEMDNTREKVITKVNTINLSRLDDIISLVKNIYETDFNTLVERIKARNEERNKNQEEAEKEPQIQVIIFGIDEQGQTFLNTLDNDDNFTTITKEPSNKVFGTGTFDILIEGRATQWFNVLKKDTNLINTAEWTYNAIFDISNIDIVEGTVDFPADYVLINKNGIYNGHYNVLYRQKMFKPSNFDSNFNMKIN